MWSRLDNEAALRYNQAMNKTNYYFKLTVPQVVYENIGCTSSNTYVGSSQMLANVWRPLQLEAGDFILDLCGGLFAVRANGGLMVPIAAYLNEKHPFEKTYGGVTPFHETVLPKALRLVEVEQVEVAAHTYEPNKGILPYPVNAKRIGHNIDLLVDN